MSPVDSLLSWLAEATVRGSLLIAAVLGLQIGLRRWMPARWRLALWLPVLLALGWPLAPLRSGALHRCLATARGAAEWCCPSAGGACLDSLEAAAQSALAQSTRFGWAIIAGCWLVGAAWVFGVVLCSYLAALRRLRQHRQTPSAAVLRMVDDGAREMRLRRPPQVLLSAKVAGPAVAGLWRPVLLLPADFPGALDAEESRLVLRHELLHIRRHDLLVNWLLSVLQALHWFNPIAWLAFARIRGDREEACDEAVLAESGPDARAVYGYALIKMGSALTPCGGHLGILHAVESAAALRRRIRAVAAYRRSPQRWAVAWSGLLAALTALGVTRAPEQWVSTPAGGGAALAQARRILLPRVYLQNVTVAEAVEHVQRLAEAHDANGSGVRVSLTPEGAKSAAESRITLSLQAVSVWQALQSISAQADLGLDGNPEMICLRGRAVTVRPSPEKLRLPSGTPL